MASAVFVTVVMVMGRGAWVPMALTGFKPDATKQSHQRVRVGRLVTAWCQR